MFYSIRRLLQNILIIRGKEKIVSAGDGDNEGIKKRAAIEIVMQICISCIILLFAYFVLINNPERYGEEIRKYIYGLIGLVVGYWMR